MILGTEEKIIFEKTKFKSEMKQEVKQEGQVFLFQRLNRTKVKTENDNE